MIRTKKLEKNLYEIEGYFINLLKVGVGWYVYIGDPDRGEVQWYLRTKTKKEAIQRIQDNLMNCLQLKKAA